LDDVVDIINETGIDGIVATNTTISRAGLLTSKEKVESIGSGGLSGKILSDRATEVVAYIHEKSSGKIPIIGVGGIYSAKTAHDKINAGADLVQVYSGFIYGGPQMIKNIAKAL
jgi:dihydroorotate dehydrogenase